MKPLVHLCFEKRRFIYEYIIQMKKLQLALTLAILLTGKIFAQSSSVVREYVQQYKQIAMEEMKRTGVPAAITLAQGIHETSAGQSDLVIKSNNHFGIKCKAEWTGPSVSHDDDARGECFRKYESPEDSYRDHSDFLAKRPNYASLFNLDPTDFEAWAWGLKKAGYATNPKYPQILIKLIRDYDLQDYTLIAMGLKTDESPNDERWVKNPEIKTDAKKTTYPTGVFKINSTRAVFVSKGVSFLSIANEHNVPLRRLFEFNEMNDQEVAANDMLLFIQRKRKTGANEFHAVANGESLYEIAQAEGIRLESLLSYNFLKADMQPLAGETLYLQKHAPAMPRLITAASMVTVVAHSDSLAKQEENGNGGDYFFHTVKPKETVYSISKKYAVNLRDVLRWNDLQGTDLKTGQQLRIKRM